MTDDPQTDAAARALEHARQAEALLADATQQSKGFARKGFGIQEQGKLAARPAARHPRLVLRAGRRLVRSCRGRSRA